MLLSAHNRINQIPNTPNAVNHHLRVYHTIWKAPAFMYLLLTMHGLCLRRRNYSLSINSIPSPKDEGGRAFEVELLSTKPNDSNQAKAHERDCSIVTLSDLVCVENHNATHATNRTRHAVYPGSGHDSEHRPVDRRRG